MGAFEYRPSIDGLRGIAVLSVIVFHLRRDWLPGPVGVDVFFVISGYLITSMVARDLELNRFDLLAFYQRRIARIFPAFMAVVISTLAAAFFIYSSQDLASAAVTAAFASVSAANIKLLQQGSYFHLSRDAQPFLHCWSLSLVEQFYILFPVAVLLVRKRSSAVKTAVLAAAAAASFVACIYLTRTNQVAAFYLLPTRAWELLVGCALAVCQKDVRAFLPVRLGSVVPMAGLALIGSSFVLLNEGPGFPGYQALLPVLGTALVLGSPRQETALSERLLSSAPLAAIGRASYSLYLWHWPISSLVDYKLYAAPDAERAAWKVGLTLLATVVSFRLVESPARKFLNDRKNRSVAFGFLCCSILLVVPAGIWVRRAYYVNTVESEVARGGRVINAGGAGGSIILMGDSHASMYGRMMKEIAEERDYRLIVISVAAGDPLPPAGDGDNPLWRDSLAVVERERPAFLFLACNWERKLKEDRERLPAALAQLLPHVGRVVLLTQPPLLPEGATREAIREGSRAPFFEDPNRRQSRQAMNGFVLSVDSGKVTAVDVERHFVPNDSGEVLFSDERGRQLYQDKNHVSSRGANRVKGSVFGALSVRG